MIELDSVNLDIDGRRATIQLNRPRHKNAMSPALHDSMNEALDRIEREKAVRVVVITGAGDSFCGGMDLEKCFLEPFSTPREFIRINDVAFRWFRRLKAFPAVTIASVNGWCFGGGVQLVGVCDLAVAAEEATFGLSEINFGIFAGGGTMWAASQNLNRKRCLYYALTGDRFTGVQAADMGFVNFAVPLSELAGETDRIVSMLVDKNRDALSATKAVFERARFMDLPQSIEWEMGKLYELSYTTENEWINGALTQFRERKYQPGLGAYKLAEEG